MRKSSNADMAANVLAKENTKEVTEPKNQTNVNIANCLNVNFAVNFKIVRMLI